MTSSRAKADISLSEIDEITGCSKGRTMSLSMSTNDAADGGGNGDTLRKMPVK